MPGHIIVAGHEHVSASKQARAIPFNWHGTSGPFPISLRHLDPD
jgi:hypothetical protein